MRFQREWASGVINEIFPLIAKHYEEISLFKDIPLNPDFETYEAVDRMGSLRVFTARSDEGSLVGYEVFFIRKHPHYGASIQATQDLLFLLPEYRRGFEAISFLKWNGEELKREGAQLIYRAVTERNDYSRLLNWLGFEKTETLYVRRVD